MSSYVGLDVGGTKIAAARLEDGKLGDVVQEPTRTDETDALLDQLASLVEQVRADDTVAVGVGAPSVIEFATGLIRYSVNIPLADVPLRSVLSEKVGLPVYVENDASCAALAESHEACPDIVMLTVGTGVGGGVVIGGRLFRGVTGGATELGHLLIAADVTDGEPEHSEKFPQPGSLESLASGRALDALAREIFGDDSLTGKDAVEAAQNGDERGVRALRILGQRLGVGIANVVNAFEPSEVVIGGGVSAAGDLLLAPARATAEKFILPGVGTETTIRLARRGNEAGVLGAALLAATEHERGDEA
jgi:glucokinase